MSSLTNKTAFVLVVNDYRSEEDIGRFKIMFKNADCFFLVELSEKNPLCPKCFSEVEYMLDLFRNANFTKILIYFVGHGSYIYDSMHLPGATYCWNPETVHDRCIMSGFQTSVVIFDCFLTSSEQLNDSETMWINYFKQNHLIYSLSSEELNELMKAPGHIMVSSASKPSFSLYLPRIGSIFSSIFWRFVFFNVRSKKIDIFHSATRQTNQLFSEKSQNYDYPRCSVQGSLLFSTFWSNHKLQDFLIDKTNVLDHE